MAPSGISLNKPAAITIVILVAGGVILYKWGWSSPSTGAAETDISFAGGDKSKPDSKPSDAGASQVLDVNKLPDVPAQGDLSAISVQKKTISFSVKGKTMNIFSQQTEPQGSSKLTVLLLHGQAFTSQNWVDIKTLQLLAAWGYTAIAIDLPGYGETKDVLDSIAKEDFLTALIGTLGSSPVIVSPSMSGGFSLPYLFADRSDSTQRARAFIPVAPVATEQYKESYPKSQLPTLIVYGSEDASLGETSKENLKLLPRSQIVSLPGAKHACYIDKPDLFHKALHYFLAQLTK